MTFYCPECATRWWPYQCADGKCPQCATGTKVKHGERADHDANARFKAIMAARVKVDERARATAAFDAFYADREERLNGLDTLPLAEPGPPFLGQRAKAVPL